MKQEQLLKKKDMIYILEFLKKNNYLKMRVLKLQEQ